MTDPEVGNHPLPRPGDGEVELLLQTVWDLLADGEHWPPYRTVDRLLYQNQQIDIDTVIARTPSTLLLGGRPAGGARALPDAQLSLTVAGAAVCTGAEYALAVFLAAVRRAAEVELHNPPVGQNPTLTFEEAAAAARLQLTDRQLHRVARQSGLLLHPEPWISHVLLYEGGWELTVDRRVRPYAGVTDLGGYWQIREHQRGAAATKQAEVPAARAGAERVVELQDRRWWIGPQIGSGGFGQVFSARDDAGFLAAIKFVPKQPGSERELLFADLDGVRNVVPVLDSGEVDDAWVLVMPRAEQSLQERLLEAQCPLPVDEALAVLRDVVTALTDLSARQEPIVHRDLKPANVLLLEGAWCLADFGISRYAEASTAPDTHKHAMSAPYAAPERWRGERATAAADVYAVGVMAFELLSGARPFPGPGLEDFREQHLHDDPPPLTDASPRLAALVAECLQKAPQARPTPAKLLARLERAGDGEHAPGSAALAVAYQRQVGEAAAESAAVSRARSEQQRREELATAASRTLDSLSEQLLEVVLDAAPSVNVDRRREMKWVVQLNSAKFGLAAATPFDGESWGDRERPALDVLAFASISVVFPADPHGYEGRSHSLYYCDAQRPSSYAWYETAFMYNPLSGGRSGLNPFALTPGEGAAMALSPGMARYQVAWPFTELVVGELDEFIDRWVGWFAAATQGTLTHPSQIPEREPQGSWRR